MGEVTKKSSVQRLQSSAWSTKVWHRALFAASLRRDNERVKDLSVTDEVKVIGEDK